MPGRGSGRAMIHAGRGPGVDSPAGNLIFNSTGTGQGKGTQASGRAWGRAVDTPHSGRATTACLSLIPTLSDTPPPDLLTPRNGPGFSTAEGFSVTETGGRA